VAVLLTGPQLRQATDEVKEIERRKLNLIVARLGEGLNEAERLLEYANVNYRGRLNVRILTLWRDLDDLKLPEYLDCCV